MESQPIRRQTRTVQVGSLKIGAAAPISIQSMTNTDPHDAETTYRQVKALEEAGCEIVRLAIPDPISCDTIYRLKERGIAVPLVADIHFDYRIALAAVEAGIDKIRINPGNIGSEEHIRAVAKACQTHGVPIRIGINSGSLEKHILRKYGAPTPQALAESALYHAKLLEKYDFTDIVISIKSSNVLCMIEANRIVGAACDYPLHLGVTEAGRGDRGLLKSAIGIGTLLCEGLGDTIRVSLTDSPLEEVKAAQAILRTIGLSSRPYIDIISCPTCGRTKIDLVPICEELDKRLQGISVTKKLTVAVMGCVVNGPGEAAQADIGIAGAVGEAVLFSHGKNIRRVSEKNLVDELIYEIQKLLESE